MNGDLRFATIDLEARAATCIAFRRDSYVCSFGSDDMFVQENGVDGQGYVEWLARRIAACPEGHVHVWRGDSIAGQLEMLVRPDLTGYVNLFYLIPSERGSGAGSALQRYVVDFFCRSGVRVVHLTVSPTNARALAYYRKHGWRSLGPNPARRGNLTLELVLSPSQGSSGS